MYAYVPFTLTFWVYLGWDYDTIINPSEATDDVHKFVNCHDEAASKSKNWPVVTGIFLYKLAVA